MDYFTLSSCFLALLSILPSNTATCPSTCSCKQNDRYVDCSGKGLTELPENIQDNIISLNISHNSIKDLGDVLKNFNNMRFLDMSHNLLTHMPTEFPRALWEIYAVNNRIKVLKKEDTVSQWNLKKLDLSNNLIERAFLINNTLSSLKFLNFSGNRFWTVPTNMPYNLVTLDLSHNNLHSILPDTFHQDRLSELYLNNNRFTFIPNGTFDQLHSLQLITLYGNFWECNSQDSLFYLLTWIKMATANVVEKPCTEEAQFVQKTASISYPSTMTSPSHTSAFTGHQTETRILSTRPRESEANTFQSLVGQETGTSSFLQLVTNASLNSLEPSSVREPDSQITTQNSSIQTLGSIESSSSTPSVTTNTTDGPSLSTMSTTTPESTSKSTVLTESTTMTNKLNGTVNSQTSGSMSRSTFESMPTKGQEPIASTTFSTVSEPNIVTATTSHAAMRSISNTIKIIPTSLTAVPKINGISGTTRSVKQNVTTPQNTNSKAHVCTGITLYIMVLTMLVPLVV
ncbi:oligodendrocyte-myelin glycoprotein [Mustelus asterias]